jgi:hypothetical protein
MSEKRNPEDEHVQVLISGVPVALLRWFDMEAYRTGGAKRGGRKLGTGRSGLIVKAMSVYRDDRKRRAQQNKERKAERAAD